MPFNGYRVARFKTPITERMRLKFDSPSGRQLYSKRIGTVEPVFGNIQNKDMRRFAMRGHLKVNAQWQLFTIVHNIEKAATKIERGARGRGGQVDVHAKVGSSTASAGARTSSRSRVLSQPIDDRRESLVVQSVPALLSDVRRRFRKPRC